MNTKYLFPYKLKRFGWILLILGIIFGIIFLINEPRPYLLDIKVYTIAKQEILEDPEYFSLSENNVFDELIGLLLIVGSILIAFSKEKFEDEYISKIRLESLMWATYVNYTILILAIIFVYDTAFLWVLVFNMFTILFFFLIRFNWALVRSRNQIPG